MLIGLCFLIANRDCPHSFYRGTIETCWKAKGGLIPGLFIFTPGEEEERTDRIRVYEYGHTMQSLLLGPLMLPVGIISVL